MALTLTDGNFGYSGTLPTRTPVGDPNLARTVQSFGDFSKAYGNSMPAFGGWFNEVTKGLTPQQQAAAWSDIVGDFGTTYRNTAGQDFIPNQSSLQSLAQALGTITPRKDYTSSIIGDVTGKAQNRGATNPITGDLSYNPTTSTINRTASLLGPTGNRIDTATDQIGNIFDYIMQGSLAPTDTKTNIVNGAVNTGNRSSLQNLYSGLSSDRLTGDLTNAFQNITGISALPADFLSGIKTGSYDYYSNPSKYQTDYQSQLGNLFNTQSVKNALDPAYTQAQTKMGFANNDANRSAFNTAASQYGLQNLMTDVSDWVPPAPTTPTPNPVTPTPTPQPGTGTTPTGVTREARYDMNRGSRYFSTDTGQYTGGLGGLYGGSGF